MTLCRFLTPDFRKPGAPARPGFRISPVRMVCLPDLPYRCPEISAHQLFQLGLRVNQALIHGLHAVDDVVHLSAQDGVELGPLSDHRTIHAGLQSVADHGVLGIGGQDFLVLQAGVAAGHAAGGNGGLLAGTPMVQMP